MLLLLVRSAVRSWLAPDLHLWVLEMVLVGMLASSVGMVNSHGLAALAQGLHGDTFVTEQGHGHENLNAHDVSGDAAIADEPLLHPHHGADHSHDNGHMPSMALGPLVLLPPAWCQLAPSRMKGRVVHRLERPPMI